MGIYEAASDERKLELLKAYISTEAPFWGHFLTGRFIKVSKPEIAATTGRDVFFYDKFFEFTAEEATFVAVHELCHIFCGDCIPSTMTDKKIANIAMDIIRNSMLMFKRVEYSLEKIKFTPPEKHKGFVPKVDFSDELPVTLYTTIINQREAVLQADPDAEYADIILTNKKNETWGFRLNFTGGAGGLGGEGGFDELADLIETSGLTRDEVLVEIQKALQSIKQAGLEAGNVAEQVATMYSARINWKAILRNTMNKLVTTSNTCFSNPLKSLRYMGLALPSFKREWKKDLAGFDVFIDTSGSVDSVDLSYIAGEIQRANKMVNGESNIWYWDTELQGPLTFKEASNGDKFNVYGRGGTSVSAAAAIINAKDYKGFPIFITDGYFGDTDLIQKDCVWIIFSGDKRFNPAKGKVIHV